MYWAFDGCLKPGSLILPSYLRHSCRYLLQCCSDMRTEVAGNRGYVSLYRRHACEVDSSSTSKACRRLRPEVFLVAGGAMSSFVRVVLQALLAAMLQVARRHMRTRLNRGDSNRKTFIGMAKRCPWLLDRGGCLTLSLPECLMEILRWL